VNRIYKLKDWSVVARAVPVYIAPELSANCLGGTLVDSGKEIVTSTIVGVQGRIIRTRNSIYELIGPPEAAYAQYCERIGRTIDDKQPIAMVKR
jgi:hypothetical protein